MQPKHAEKDEGLAPNAPGGEESVVNEERSLDIGESGQFAPGGYYNQQAVTKPDRLTLEDEKE